MKHIIWSNEPGYNGYLEFEEVNLNKPLDNYLVMYGVLDLWDGRRTGYKVLKSVRPNLNGIFHGTVGDFVTYYCEDGEICCDDVHHDGTNHYTYRVLKNDITESEFDESAFDDGLQKAIEQYTEPLGELIADIYGW